MVHVCMGASLLYWYMHMHEFSNDDLPVKINLIICNIDDSTKCIYALYRKIVIKFNNSANFSYKHVTMKLIKRLRIN